MERAVAGEGVQDEVLDTEVETVEVEGKAQPKRVGGVSAARR